jgi:hypothetical protein
MTIIEPRYFEETVGRLRERGHDVRHFALLAERATVLRRLRERGLGHALAPSLDHPRLPWREHIDDQTYPVIDGDVAPFLAGSERVAADVHRAVVVHL